MRTRRLIAVLACGCLAVAVLVAGTIWLGLALRTRLRYGTLAGRDRPAISVEAGHRFTLTVPDRGRSVGDRWRARVEPADAAGLVREEMVLRNPVEWIVGPALGGGAGTRYFVFEARHRGRCAVILSNCFQGCWDADTRARSESITWTVTVS